MPLKNKLAMLLGICTLSFVLFTCANDKKESKQVETRIISLAPHVTEIIYALQAQEQLVAVSDFCRFPEEAIQKEKIGGLLNPNIEKIVILEPTHLFGVPSHQQLDQDLHRFGLGIVMTPNEKVSDVLLSIKKIGNEIGREEQATRLIGNINRTLDSLRIDHAENHKVTAALVIGRENGTLRNITVAGKNTYLDEIWKLVGGENSYSDLPTRYGTINLESILLRNPEVIIEFDLERIKGVFRSGMTAEWELLSEVEAIKNGNLFVVGGDHTLIPGPRIGLLAKDFAEIIHSATRDRKQISNYKLQNPNNK
jgi:iron complex transport system substrate-binding protein